MKKILVLFSIAALALQLSAQQASSTSIPFKMEELTSPEFAQAVVKSGGVCIIPLGIIEKHGPHLPLGTDLFEAR